MMTNKNHLEFIEKQKNKFNAEHFFHEVLIRNGWKGDELTDELSLKKHFPYKTYIRFYDDDEKLIELLNIEIINNEATITSISDNSKSISCNDAFACYAELEHRGDTFKAAMKVADEISDETALFVPLSKQSKSALPVLLTDKSMQDSPFSYLKLVPTPKGWKYANEKAIRQSFDIGIILGDTLYCNTLCDVSYNGDGHLITFGISRSGKGTAVLIPTLLRYDASTIVVDPKGELAAHTAKHRRDVLGHDVYVLNPFDEFSDKLKNDGFTSANFNPLAALDHEKDINFLDEVSIISETLIVQNGDTGKNWTDGAKIIIECLIIYVCIVEPMEGKNLARVRHYLTLDQTKLVALFRTISESEDKKYPTYLKQKVSILLDKNEKGVGSYISTAVNQTSFLDAPFLVNDLSKNDIDFLDLKRKKVTIYLVLPASKIERYSRWLRLFIGTSLEKLMSTPKQPRSKNVLFLIDECASLGHQKYLEEAMPNAAGYGIRIWSFFQDFNQLVKCYGREGAYSFLANAHVKQYFAPNDPRSAEHIFKEIGTGNFIPASDGSMLQITEPAQLKNLHPDCQMFVFANSQLPFFTNKNYWYNSEELRKLVDTIFHNIE